MNIGWSRDVDGILGTHRINSQAQAAPNSGPEPRYSANH
jgi:hypothetical protein